MIKRTLALMGLFCGLMVGQQDRVVFNASAPPPVSSVNVTRVGNQGAASYWYWVVAHYPIGNANPTGAMVINAPNTLSVTNYLRVDWSGMPQALSYDLLRTTTNSLPSSCASCAVATGLTVTTFNDVGGALGPYVQSSSANATGSIRLDNVSKSVPFLDFTPKIDWIGQIVNKPFVDVRDYGADPTGATDSTVNIQAAITAAQNNGGGIVWLPNGTYPISSTLNVTSSNVWILGSGQGGTNITRTGDFGDSIYVAGPVENVRIEGLKITHTVNFSAGPPTSIVNKPTSGANVHLFNCWECVVRNNSLWNLPYGVDADTVGRTFIDYNEFGSPWDNLNPNVQVGITAVYLHHSASGYGYPTYTYVEHNEIVNSGYGSTPRTITVNGTNIPNHTDALGALYGIWVASCEVCEISHNSIEWGNSSGIHIAALPAHAVADALLDVVIEDNFIDYNRLYGIDFDMSSKTDSFTLNFRVMHNRIGSVGGTMNGIYFAPPATPWDYVRTAAKTVIADNQIFGTIGAGILMLSGGNTSVHGNQITDYNFYNAYPTNSLTCIAGGCTGDRIGSSGIYQQYPAINSAITNNQIGGSYAGGSYGGAVYTVGGVGIGYFAGYPTNSITAPNADTGTQTPNLRIPSQFFDPAFTVFPPTVKNANLLSDVGVNLSGCGALAAGSSIMAGTITSDATGVCSPALVIDPATSANGWSCTMQNLTNPGATNAMYQTVSSTNGAVFSGTTVTGDVLVYACSSY